MPTRLCRAIIPPEPVFRRNQSPDFPLIPTAFNKGDPRMSNPTQKPGQQNQNPGQKPGQQQQGGGQKPGQQQQDPNRRQDEKPGQNPNMDR
jgi:type VI secretion system secreted protein VgrG